METFADAVVAVGPPMLVCPKCGSTYTRQLERCGLDGESLIESSIDPLIGRQFDRYTIVEPIGAGGMATVYRASHAHLDRSFAIKVLHGQLAMDKTIAKRFQREAKALSRIKHNNVVSIADFGVTEEGLLFMVMEYLEGRTISDALRQDGPFPPTRTAAVMRGVAEGLVAAHKRGYVHRDLKPGNIILEHDGETETPKILDFGLVGILESEEPTTQLTQHGQFFGTPIYMSPEQASGGEIGATSDIYSLGVCGYVMLTGSPPFDGEPREVAYMHISEDPPRPPLSYGGLTPLVLEMLAKEARDRPQSAKEVIGLIDDLGLLGPVPKKRRRSRSRSRSVAPKSTPDAPTRPERPLLSEPVLEAERKLTVEPAFADDDSLLLQRRALGLSAHRGKLAALVVLGIVGVAAWQLQEDDAFALRQIKSFFVEPEAGAEPEPEPKTEPPPPTEPERVAVELSRPAEEKAPPKPKKPKVKKPRPKKPAAKAPTPTPEPGKEPVKEPEPAATPDAGTAPVEEVVEIELPKDEEPPPSGKTFRELDMSLGWALNAKGLSWDDLAAVAETDARRWSRWFKATKDPEPKVLDGTYNALIRAVDGITVDEALLEQKLGRAVKTLRRIRKDQRDDRYSMLASRRDALKREIAQRPLAKRPVDLAAEITLLEADAAAALREAIARLETETSTT